jgi:F-type H+-transporting ATPase subunit epsilon
VALEVHVVTPEREVWTGPAQTVIARGVDGEVGILAGHAPLMVQLTIGPLRILREDHGDVAAVIDGGFMHVTSSPSGEEGGGTRVDVLAAHAELAGDIDLEAARARASALEEELAQNHDTHLAEADIAAARAELRKALARIELVG